MIIRKAMTQDSRSIQQIARTTWHHTYEDLIPRTIQDQFLNEAYSDKFMGYRIPRTIVAEIDEAVIGFADFTEATDDQKASVRALYILPEYQGRGAGSALIKDVLSKLEHAVTIYVDVEKENEPALAFYNRMGFVLEEEYSELFYGHTIHTVKLRLDLK